MELTVVIGAQNHWKCQLGMTSQTRLHFLIMTVGSDDFTVIGSRFHIFGAATDVACLPVFSLILEIICLGRI